MKIQLNGESRELTDALTVELLILQLDLEPTRVAIEVNLNVVRRKEWPETILRDGDHIEIVQFVGGG